MTKPPADPAFEARKRASVAQLLFKCARLVNERAIETANDLPHAIPLRRSHTNLFPHLDFEGVRITELARRLDVSKQARWTGGSADGNRDHIAPTLHQGSQVVTAFHRRHRGSGAELFFLLVDDDTVDGEAVGATRRQPE